MTMSSDTAAQIDAITDRKSAIRAALAGADIDTAEDALIAALNMIAFRQRRTEADIFIQRTATAAEIVTALSMTPRDIAVAALAQTLQERTAPRFVEPYHALRYPALSADEAAQQAAERGIAYAGDLDD